MRGLGIGILLTTTILTISFHTSSKTQMTDEEIMRRAEELGMKSADEDKYNLDELLTPTIEPSKSADGETVETADEINTEESIESNENQTKEDTTEQSTEETTEQSVKNTVEPVEEQSGEETTGQVEEPKDTMTDNTLEEEKNENTETEEKTVVIEIKKGMTSEEVATLLKNYGVIDDNKLFNQHLIENGYEGIIDYGTFEFPKNASYDQITDIIIK